MITLRPYQEEAIKKVFEGRDRGITRPLVSLPTGAGKTVVFSELARRLNTKTLILAHRDELLKQAGDKLHMVWPDAEYGYVKAEKDDHAPQVVIASVQTLISDKRLDRLAEYDFGLCIVDEAHHATAPSYKRVIERLGFMDECPDKLLVGVSATAFRADGESLGDVFQEAVYHLPILSMIREGYLSDLKGYTVETNTDLSSVRTERGDFATGALSKAVNTADRNKVIVSAYKQYASDRRAIAFTVDVQHATDLCETFRARGVHSYAVYGAMPSDERSRAVRAFERGEINVLVNCALLVEGFDVPEVDCILMARPTKSRILYAQAVGRGLRKAPGKQDCVVIDFAANRHDLCMLPDLVGIPRDTMQHGDTVSQADAKHQEQTATEERIRKATMQAMDLLGTSRFAWTSADDHWILTVRPGEKIVLVPLGNDSRLYWPVLQVKGTDERMLNDSALPLGFAMGVAEDYVRQQGDQFARRDAKWRREPATEKQVNLLLRYGIDASRMTKGEASTAIDQVFATHRGRPRQKVAR